MRTFSKSDENEKKVIKLKDFKAIVKDTAILFIIEKLIISTINKNRSSESKQFVYCSKVNECV